MPQTQAALDVAAQTRRLMIAFGIGTGLIAGLAMALAVIALTTIRTEVDNNRARIKAQEESTLISGKAVCTLAGDRNLSPQTRVDWEELCKVFIQYQKKLKPIRSVTPEPDVDIRGH